MRAGRSLPVLMLVLASFAGLGAGGAGAENAECGAPLTQDDAGSGRDAGETLDDAVFLGRDDNFTGILGVPGTDGIDDEDLYTIGVPPDTAKLMIYLWAPSLEKAYVEHPHANFKLTGPGEYPVEITGKTVTFARPPAGMWSVLVMAAPVVACSTTGSAQAPFAVDAVPGVGTYDLYYGCNPHCADA